jgi:hypothetical protein
MTGIAIIGALLIKLDLDVVVFRVGNDHVSDGKISQDCPSPLLTGDLLLGIVKRMFPSKTNCVSKKKM